MNSSARIKEVSVYKIFLRACVIAQERYWRACTNVLYA